MAMAWLKEIGYPHERTNVNGGAIALGHRWRQRHQADDDIAARTRAPRRPLRPADHVRRRQPPTTIIERCVTWILTVAASWRRRGRCHDPRQGGTVHAASLPLPEFERLDATALADELRRGASRRSRRWRRRSQASRRAARSMRLLHATSTPRARPRSNSRHSAVPNANGGPRPAPLLGVPFALKDLGVSLNGTVTTNGCGFFRDAVADHDSTLVQRHRAAG